MKFINYLEGISGISIFPLMSLLMFFVIFSAVLVWVMFADKNYLAEMSKLPLDQTDLNLKKPTTQSNDILK
ncbi:MAG: CcoQ/FixQ family Cbb3-type cytochrome c oxidase assembly chaperone [Chitinophagales bacterium]|jgi:cytochrome c oxidase cbb3-type subunit 4|nr:CcoQ/FixQ family Cbb3-type cytochrome c oxidase assembly chaperone [Chitinophagales bacterium]MCC7056556.1 CcoQ/FixQ family Cbb3-type cytochrome c oxidase assembly chaperone [Chitinophagales bacterium]MDA0197684.1 CcoQ/FixQ family Cbb3-type cytochrome c oxidase assembly chaperone [Bacteroidota bacterium]